MEYCPDCYVIVQEAKQLGVAPWDLLKQPVFWRSVARACLDAENYAHNQLNQPGFGQPDT